MKRALTYLLLLLVIPVFSAKRDDVIGLKDILAKYQEDKCFFLQDRTDEERKATANSVYDFSDVLNASDEKRLDDKLNNFALETSNQIFVVFVDTLCGWDEVQYGYKFGEAWGIGQAQEDNGLVLLFKDKTATSKGEVFIATGRGLEGPIPDLAAHRIIDEFMLPLLREGKKTEAVNEGVDILMALAKGEYNEKVEQVKRSAVPTPIFLFLGIILLIVLISIYRTRKKIRDYAELNNISYEAARQLIYSSYISEKSGGFDGSRQGRTGRHINWGGGGFGGRGSGGGFGGFGGTGGGSFGGGGAGGSW